MTWKHLFILTAIGGTVQGLVESGVAKGWIGTAGMAAYGLVAYHLGRNRGKQEAMERT